MESSPGFPRRPPGLDLLQDRRPFYFITFNTARRRPILANEAVLRALQDFGARGYAGHGVAVGRFVLMPDHAHLVVVIPEPGITLARRMRGLKGVLGEALENRSEAQPLWQEGFFDHVPRNGESYPAKWDYARQNPARAGVPCERRRVAAAWRVRPDPVLGQPRAQLFATFA